MSQATYTRHIEPRLRESLEHSPVTVIQGPRQCGKTTLAQMVGGPLGYEYLSFDNEEDLLDANQDPIGFVDGLPEKIILDEVQRVPRLFAAIKLAVDRHRIPGRFIFTGSVNVLQVRQITDSLAGRMAIIRLHPLAQTELAQIEPKFLDAIFSPDFNLNLEPQRIPREEIAERVVAGGYPSALQRPIERQRFTWYRDYIEALIQNDIPDIAQIRSPKILQELLTLSAAQTSQLLSRDSFAKTLKVSQPTVQNYLALLEKMFLLEEIPAWYTNRKKRLVKRPKLQLCDSGVACALLDLDSSALLGNLTLAGHILETFVLQELKRQASIYALSPSFFYYREKDGAEVDIVIQRGADKLVGVEVKAASSVNKSDFRSLRRFKDAAGKAFVGGAVLYNGQRILSFGDGIYAVPIQALWE